MDSQSETVLLRSFAYLLYKDIQQYVKVHQDEYAAYLKDQAKEESSHVKTKEGKKG